MKKIIIYGLGNVGKMIVKMLTALNIDFIMVDGNPNLWGKTFMGKEILSSLELHKEWDSDTIMILCIRDDQEDAFIRYCSKYVYVKSWKNCITYIIEQYEKCGVFYSTNFEDNFKKWWFGLQTEIEFWEEAYAKPQARKRDWYDKLIGNDKFFDVFFDMSVIKSGWKILDVGSGIVSRYGEKINGGKVELVAVDPLAPWYNIFNKEYNEQFCKKEIEFGLLEELSERFQYNSVDMVIISNALDHCIDPFKCIKESLKVIKVGGYLYIKSLVRESCNEKVSGLHQWNLDINKDHEFIIWNAESFINVSRELKDVCEIMIKQYPSDERGLSGNWGFMTVNIIKRGRIIASDDEEIKLTNSCYDCFCQIARLGNYKDDVVWEEGYETFISKLHHKIK